MSEITSLAIEKEGIGVFTDSPGGTTTTQRCDFNAPVIYHDEVNLWSDDTRTSLWKQLTLSSGITAKANGRTAGRSGLWLRKDGNKMTLEGQIAFTPTTGVVTICAAGTIPTELCPSHTVVTWNPGGSNGTFMTLIRVVSDGSVAAFGTWQYGSTGKQTSALSWCSVEAHWLVDNYDDISTYIS